MHPTQDTVRLATAVISVGGHWVPVDGRQCWRFEAVEARNVVRNCCGTERGLDGLISTLILRR